jgi:uncharacterized protein (TIGR03437 family)
MHRSHKHLFLTMSCFLVMLGMGVQPLASQTPAQCASVPSNYLTACTEVQGYLSAFSSTYLSQWNGTKTPVAFATELESANCNLGISALVAPTKWPQVLAELNGFANVGVEAVTTCMSFPIAYQPFYQYINDSQDFANIVTFYQNLVKEAHRRGLKVVIEESVLFPSVATSLPLQQYFNTLSDAQVTAGRAQNAQVIAQQIQPDWLNLGSEPDTQSVQLGLSAEYTPQGYASEISAIVAQLRGAGVNGAPLLGAGCGAWQTNGSEYINALIPTGLDYIDLHIYSVNLGYLTDAAQYLDLAITAGKGVAISEAWMNKMTDEQLQGKGDLGVLGVINGATPDNAYSFWAPIDQEFLSEFVDLAYWKKLLYASADFSQYFFTYADYTQSASLSSSQVTAQVDSTEAAAFQSGVLSPTGQAFATAVTLAGRPVMASAASGAVTVADDSIVSIYGSGLAATATAATSLPLPTTLDGVTVTATDGAGTQIALPLFYVGPLQINAEIPQSLKTGLVAVTITGTSGTVTTPVITSPTAPGLFSANQNAKGVAAAQFITNLPNGSQTTVPVFQCSAGAGCQAVPLNLSQGGTSALVLYGTGLRNASLADVTVEIGSMSLPASFAGASPNYTGLDQVNVLLPQSLAGSGTVNVSVSISGTSSNEVTVDFQ